MEQQSETEWEDLLFIGAHGYVTAVDRADGERRWTTNLEKTGYSIVSLLLDDGILYAATSGHVFALHPETGEVFWRNSLKGLGRGHVCMATSTVSLSPHSNPIQQAQYDQDAAAHSSSSAH